jgi:hypothetical protein
MWGMTNVIVVLVAGPIYTLLCLTPGVSPPGKLLVSKQAQDNHKSVTSDL